MQKNNSAKMALIVGGSQGIGRSLVEQFAEHGWRVIEASRNVGKNEANILHDHVDLNDVTSIDAFADRLRDTDFDLIHLNAGMVGDFAADAQTVAREAIAELFYVNAVGPLRLAKRLLPLLRGKGVVAFTTSAMTSMATYDSLGLPLYRASKAALNSLTRDFYPQAPPLPLHSSRIILARSNSRSVASTRRNGPLSCRTWSNSGSTTTLPPTARTIPRSATRIWKHSPYGAEAAFAAVGVCRE
jgi:NADP-dependent 3-hydroxy acid dehydrogenase YdfG